MDSTELERRLDAQDAALERIGHDIHRIKQFFLWMIIGSVVTFVIPLIAAAIIVPIVARKYLESFGGIL